MCTNSAHAYDLWIVSDALRTHLQVGDVEPMKFVVQYLTQAAVKLPRAGDGVQSLSSSNVCGV